MRKELKKPSDLHKFFWKDPGMGGNWKYILDMLYVWVYTLLNFNVNETFWKLQKWDFRYSEALFQVIMSDVNFLDGRVSRCKENLNWFLDIKIFKARDITKLRLYGTQESGQRIIELSSWWYFKITLRITCICISAVNTLCPNFIICLYI